MAKIIVWKGYELAPSEDDPNSYLYQDDIQTFCVELNTDLPRVLQLWSASVQICQVIGEAFADDPHHALSKALINLYEDLTHTRHFAQELSKRRDS